MRRILLWTAAVLAAMALWALLVLVATLEGWGRQASAPSGDARAFFETSVAAIDAAGQGAVAFVLLENGKPVGEHYVSAGAPATRDTLFQLASLSKWATALGVLKLAADGRLDLDAPVSRYLTRWQLPESEFGTEGVTARRLLSHTAGLTDGLGYLGFAPGTPVQTLEASLTEAADPMPGADGRTRIGRAPGSSWSYSGGGYALLQILIEEISGEPFGIYMKRAVLDPLGMTQATFDLAEAEAAGLAPVSMPTARPAPIAASPRHPPPRSMQARPISPVSSKRRWKARAIPRCRPILPPPCPRPMPRNMACRSGASASCSMPRRPIPGGPAATSSAMTA